MSNDLLGRKIRFAMAFGRTCVERFRVDDKQQSKPHPFTLDGEGYVVGIRNVIMDNYHYHAATTDEYGGCDDAPRADGTKERVLLVSRSIYEEPLIVRFADVKEPL